MGGHVVVIVGKKSDVVRMSAVISNLGGRGSVLWLRSGEGGHLADEEVIRGLDLPCSVDHLGVQTHGVAWLDDLMVCRELESRRAQLVITVGAGPAAQIGARAARTRGVPVIHVDDGREENRESLTVAFEDVFCMTAPASFATAVREAIPRSRLLMAGSTYPEVIAASRRGQSASVYDSPLSTTRPGGDRASLVMALSSGDPSHAYRLRSLAKELLTAGGTSILVAPNQNLEMLRKTIFDGERIRLISALSHLEFLTVMAGADWILSDSAATLDEASWLQLASLPRASVSAPGEAQKLYLFNPERGFLSKRSMTGQDGGDGLASDRICLVAELMLDGATAAQAVGAAEEAFGTAWDDEISVPRRLSAHGWSP